MKRVLKSFENTLHASAQATEKDQLVQTQNGIRACNEFVCNETIIKLHVCLFHLKCSLTENNLST